MVSILLFVLYFLFLHQKVLNKLGLTQRDDTLMLIGFLMSTVISTVLRVVESAFQGHLDLGSLIFAALVYLMVYFNYKRL